MDYIKVKLPELKTFKSLKKDTDPFMKFWNHVLGELGTETKGFDVTSVKITKADYDVIKDYAFKWFKKQSPVNILNKGKQESSFGFHCLNISPSEFYEEQPESGYAYVSPDWKEVQQSNIA